jgi:hypothetical protein
MYMVFLGLACEGEIGLSGSLINNFSLLSCRNKEFGNKYFLFLSQTYFCAKDKRILNLPKMK